MLFPQSRDATIVASASGAALRTLIHVRFIAATEPPTRALVPFSDRHVAALVREAKYHGSERAMHMLGTILSEYLEGAVPGAVIVPMPLSLKRRRERGYNQCEEIARRALGARRDARFMLRTDILERVTDTEHQARLGRAKRMNNLRGALKASVPDSRVRYLILDDVITTGATMREAVRAMYEAGAIDVVPLAIAHA